MSRKVKKSDKIRKILVIGVTAALIGSVIAVVYRPPEPPKPPELQEQKERALTCGTGVANSNRYIEEFVIPSECSQPVAIAVDHDGKVWFAESATRKIGRFDPSTNQFAEFALPDAEKKSSLISIWVLKLDDEGNLWFPDVLSNSIWKFDPVMQRFESFKIPSTAEDFGTSFPINLDFDANGSIWFSEIYAKKLGMLTLTENTSNGITEFPTSVDLSTLGPLAVAPDGKIWFTALTYSVGGQIMRFDPQTKHIESFKMSSAIINPVGIAFDKKGNLWINDHGSNAFFMFDPETDSVTSYVTSLPRASTSFELYDRCLSQPNGSPETCGGLPVSLPYWNAVDTDGRIWFNLHQGNALAVFDPKEETLVEYFVPSQNPHWTKCEDYDQPCGIANPLQFTISPNGKVWFTEMSESKIAILDPQLPIPISIDIVNKHLQVSKGDSIQVELKVTSTEKLDSEVSMRISSTPTGRLANMTANFSNSKLLFSEPAAKTVTLTLTPGDNLLPGGYRITVSATNNELTYSKILHLTVKE